MIHYLRFAIDLIFAVLGLALFVVFPTGWGFAGFVGTFIVGSIVSERVFKRYATPEEIREDLRHRVDTE